MTTKTDNKKIIATVVEDYAKQRGGDPLKISERKFTREDVLQIMLQVSKKEKRDGFAVGFFRLKIFIVLLLAAVVYSRVADPQEPTGSGVGALLAAYPIIVISILSGLVIMLLVGTYDDVILDFMVKVSIQFDDRQKRVEEGRSRSVASARRAFYDDKKGGERHAKAK
jgi:hypothetical protein